MKIRRIAAGLTAVGALAVGVVGVAQPAVAAPATSGWRIVQSFPAGWEGLIPCWAAAADYRGKPGVIDAECRVEVHADNVWVNFA